MGKVIAGITTSVDGYVAGPDDGPGKGLGEGIKNFKKGIKEGDEAESPKLTEGEASGAVRKEATRDAATPAPAEKLSSEKSS